MKALKLVALTVVAVVVPGLLAASIYLVSAHSFETPASAVPRVRGNIASPNPEWSPGPRKKSAKPKSKGAGKQAPGRCGTAKRAQDPGCTAGGDDDDSVSGPDVFVGSGPDNSGAGSDNSGSNNSGSGEDNSGSNNSGSVEDNSGSDEDNSGSGSDDSGSGSDDSDDLGSSGGDD